MKNKTFKNKIINYLFENLYILKFIVIRFPKLEHTILENCEG